MIHNLKLEAGVISTLISDESLLIKHIQDINPNLFWLDNNVVVIKAILHLKDKSITPDYDALENYLVKQNKRIDIYDYVEPLNVNNFEDYINQLKELTYKRELKRFLINYLSIQTKRYGCL